MSPVTRASTSSQEKPIAPHAIEDITGPFRVDVAARFDDLWAGHWQRIFDIGNGPGQDNIWLGQLGNTNAMAFELWVSGQQYRIVADNAIVQGETAHWSVGVEPGGQMWLSKNGVRLVEAQGAEPAPVKRTYTLLGQSNWSNDTPLEGAVLGLDVTNVSEANDGGLLNQVSQIDGAFNLDVVARFDDLGQGTWQRVFDFGNGPGQDNVWLGQLAHTDDMVFEIWKSGIMHRIVAPDAILEGEMAQWSVGVNGTGRMWIEKNGVRLVEGQGAVPNDVERLNNFLGRSNWSWDTPLNGVVLDLQISNASLI